MFNINLKRSVATLGVVAGLLAAAGPASAQGGGADFPSANKAPAVTMFDYEGSPLFDNTPLDEVVFSAKSDAQPSRGSASVLDNIAATDVSLSLGRENSIECLLRAEASDEGQTQSRKPAPLSITLCHEGFEIK